MDNTCEISVAWKIYELNVESSDLCHLEARTERCLKLQLKPWFQKIAAISSLRMMERRKKVDGGYTQLNHNVQVKNMQKKDGNAR